MRVCHAPTSLASAAEATTGAPVQGRLMPVYRGLSTPPPLGLHVEFRPESAPRCFFAMWADGTVMAVCRTIADAQQALADARGQGGTE